MKIKLFSGLFIFNACMVGLVAQNKVDVAPKIPIDDFARPEIVSGIRLSRDGKTIAYSTGFNKDWVLILKDWDTDKHRSTGNGAGPQTPVWVNGERLVYGFGGSIDRDGNKQRSTRVLPSGVVFSRFTGGKDTYLLAEYYEEKVTGSYTPYYYRGYPSIVQIDTLSEVSPVLGMGGTVGQARVEDNPGDFSNWLVDGNGKFNVVEQRREALNRILFRENENSAWKALPGLDWANEKFKALAVTKDGQTLYFSQITPGGTWGIYSYDLKKRQPGELILSHDRYDIGEQDSLIIAPLHPTARLESLIMSPDAGELLGVRFVSDKPVTVWLREDLKAMQLAVDKALPGKINSIESMSDDLQRVIILSESDRDPGTYYQFDRTKAELKPLIIRRPGLKPEQMATTFPAGFKSRDGLTIRGYLTIPKGRDPKNLPMVVFPHDGPWERDTGLFNTYVQFLANRGYAVLQVNYRGSWGYGEDFARRGKRRIGREVQDDITDGTQWAIAKGIADPKRVAIIGEGAFSGYSALFGLGRNPDLYCCAISIDGVSDWIEQLSFIKKIKPEIYDRIVDHVGDPVKDEAELKDISPIAHIDSLKRPLMLVYDAWSGISKSESNAFVSALDKAGKKPETYNRQEEWDSVYELKSRTELLSRMESFLAKYMPADAVPVGVPDK